MLIASVFFSEERLPLERRLATYADLDARVRALDDRNLSSYDEWVEEIEEL